MKMLLEEVAGYSKRNRPGGRVVKRDRAYPTEYQEQAAAVKWFRTKYRKLSMCLQASCNGAFLAGDVRARAIQVSKQKNAGMVVGASDLFLAVARKGFYGCYIEVKAMNGRVTKEQLEFHEVMSEQGYFCVICKGADAVIKTIEGYLE